jgi:Ser/Thr protein kinase RdoA (MazF antagonist)
MQRLAPGSSAEDLRGTMSLNVRLEPAGLVLRVHQSWVSRARLIALQRIRAHLSEGGLLAAPALERGGATLFRCGDRWGELEPYLPNERPAPAHGAYVWLFRAMGELHRALTSPDLGQLAVPRPTIATYGPPASLARWLRVAEPAVRHDPPAAATVRHVAHLVGLLRTQWVPAAQLPVQLVHGDVRLSNVRRSPAGDPVYFDFGFLARRPRIHDLAYSLSWIILRPDSLGTAPGFAWNTLRELIGAYEDAAQTSLTPTERRALIPYTAAVPLYLAAIAGYVDDPVAHLHDEDRLQFLRIAEWLLTHPDDVAV